MTHYYLGIDVSKGYADFIMLNEKKHIIEPSFQLDDTANGHSLLYQFLRRFFDHYPDATVFAGLESTGGYENNWYHRLHRFQEYFSINVARVNPKGTDYNNKANLNRITTDKLAAKNIAEYLINHRDKINFQQKDYFYPVRRKWNFIHSLSMQKVKLLTQLESLMYDANPELLVYCKGKTPQWVLKLLQVCPSATKLAATPVDTIAQIPYITHKRAGQLIKTAQSSISSHTDPLTEDTIVHISAQIIQLIKLIDEQVKKITQHYPLPKLKLLKTFTSISDASAIGILILIGSVERFQSVKRCASFFGLHPVFKESGDGKSGIKMSKQGNKKMRATLFMIALGAINNNPVIKEVYRRNRQKGKCKMDALGVCMHKILRIVYGMLKNNQPFDPAVDRRNRTKNMHKKNKDNTKTNTLRRYQEHDKHAPVSRRQDKKRKEQENVSRQCYRQARDHFTYSFLN